MAAEWSLLQLLKPEVLADPYPFYTRLRAFEPVHWDPFLHSWVVTSYAECSTVLTKYKAARTPTPEVLEAMGLSVLAPYAQVMLRQMMFQDGLDHARLRGLCSVAFTPKRIEGLRAQIAAVAESLLDRVVERGRMEVIGEFAAVLPGRVMTRLLGVPEEDAQRLKVLTGSFAELMGNFDHDPERMRESIASLRELGEYVREQMHMQRERPGEGLLATLLASEVGGARLSEEELVGNAILLLTGGMEETANLLGSALLTLFRYPIALARMRDEPGTVQAGVEELLRLESPTQHTGRVVPEDAVLGGKALRQGDAVTVVLAAANRDPSRFARPDEVDLSRTENRHLAFGAGGHYCLGAPLTRMMAQVALPAILRRLPGLALAGGPVWRQNMGLRGLERLCVAFDAPGVA